MEDAQKCGQARLPGHVIAVRGSVVEARFAAGGLPAIDEGIEIERDEGRPLVAEVQQHLDAMTVRAVTLESASGLRFADCIAGRRNTGW
jgi:F-type H+/Na+-transporting ATPase subunit beta